MQVVLGMHTVVLLEQGAVAGCQRLDFDWGKSRLRRNWSCIPPPVSRISIALLDRSARLILPFSNSAARGTGEHAADETKRRKSWFVWRRLTGRRC